MSDGSPVATTAYSPDASRQSKRTDHRGGNPGPGFQRYVKSTGDAENRRIARLTMQRMGLVDSFFLRLVLADHHGGVEPGAVAKRIQESEVAEIWIDVAGGAGAVHQFQSQCLRIQPEALVDVSKRDDAAGGACSVAPRIRLLKVNAASSSRPSRICAWPNRAATSVSHHGCRKRRPDRPIHPEPGACAGVVPPAAWYQCPMSRRDR